MASKFARFLCFVNCFMLALVIVFGSLLFALRMEQ